MGILSSIVGGATTDGITAVGKVMDDLFTSDEERLTKKQFMKKLSLKQNELQTAINMVEASHRSLFVAGWRPFVGWGCAFALLYYTIFRDWMTIIFKYLDPTFVIPPPSGIVLVTQVLIGLLGIAGMRTVEKLGGKAR